MSGGSFLVFLSVHVTTQTDLFKKSKVKMSLDGVFFYLIARL